MKKKNYSALFISIYVCCIGHAQKPILPDYHADPSAREWDGKYWIYPSHDKVDATKTWNMEDWHVFSSEDLIHWKDHGEIFSLHDISWADQFAWAPDCMKRNGKYYFYFPANDQIGVAISSSPDGPFEDALGKPLINKNESGTRVIDPNIFIDDNGQAYLYFGQNALRVVRLKDDMITRKGKIIKLDAKNFHEGPWVHKKDSLYYLSYPSWNAKTKMASKLEYCISKSPLGPWEHKGTIMDNKSRNVHHSIVQFDNQWIIFYHIQGPNRFRRRVCAEYLYYNDDGTIKYIEMTDEGISPPKNRKK